VLRSGGRQVAKASKKRFDGHVDTMFAGKAFCSVCFIGLPWVIIFFLRWVLLFSDYMICQQGRERHLTVVYCILSGQGVILKVD
jgi:hypothetical protein